MALIRKKISGKLSAEEQNLLQHLYLKRSSLILEAPLEDLFTIRETCMKLPDKVIIEPSISCPECG